MNTVKLSVSTVAVLFSSWVFASPVNINKASASEISEALNGVGMSKAEAIVQYREENGSFKSAGDIMQVKGIGESTFEKNKKDILIK